MAEDSCEELVQEMMVMLQRIYVEAHHTDGCSNRYSGKCSCWKSPTRELIKRAIQAGLKGDKVASTL